MPPSPWAGGDSHIYFSSMPVGMCCREGYGFQAVGYRSQAILFQNWVKLSAKWSVHYGLVQNTD